MTLTTEYFVLVVFFVSTLLIWKPLRGSDLKGRNSFLLSLISYLVSNFCTVAEEWAFFNLLNDAEHLFILIGSFFMMMGIVKSFSGRDKM